jgi:hypothetical protein
MSSRSIKILDDNSQLVGELMTASNTDILKYLSKGLKVVDARTNESITTEMVSSEIGVSDGEIILE